MPIHAYNGTNPGSDSGYFRRYFSEFKDTRGVQYRLEILDTVTASTGFPFANDAPAEFLLGRDGVTIDWDGAGDDLHDPIITSTLSADFLLEGSYHHAFPTVLASATDERFAVGLFRLELESGSTPANPVGKWRPEWFGMLLPEGVEYVQHESNEFLRLKAIDGLAYLNDIGYLNDDGVAWSYGRSLAGHLSRCLSKIPTSSLWSYNSSGGTTATSNSAASAVEFLTEVAFLGTSETLAYTANVPDSVSTIRNVYANAAPFYKIETSTDDFGGRFVSKEVTTCGKVIKEVATALGSRLFQSDGRFWFVHWGAFDDRTARLHHFRNPGHLEVKDPKAVSSDTSTGVFDMDANNYEPLRGITRKHLFPIGTSVSTHKKGGSREILSLADYDLEGQTEVPKYLIRFATYSGGADEIQNQDAVVPGGSSPIFRGEVKISTGLVGTSDVTPDITIVGLQCLLDFTIKVGDFYLKRDVVLSTDSVEIQRDLAANLAQKDYSQDGNVEWTTTPSTYTIRAPFVGMNYDVPVVLQGDDNDIERVGGFHVHLHPDGERFKYQNGETGEGGIGTLDLYYRTFDLNWVVPPLPDSVAIHEGITFSVSANYKLRGGGTGLVSAIPDLWAASNASNPRAGEILSFRVFDGEATDDSDVQFIAQSDGNRASLDAATTLLGDYYGTGSPPGALKIRDLDAADVNTFNLSDNTSWGTVEAPTSFDYLHAQLARNTLIERAKVLPVLSGTFVHDPSSAVANYEGDTPDGRPAFWNLIQYTIGSTAYKYAPLSMSWTVRSGAFDFEGFLVDVDRTTLPDQTADTKDRAGDNNATTGRPPTSAVTGSNAGTSVIASRIVTTANSGGISATDQAKLDAITINGSGAITDFTVASGSDPLDVSEVSGAASTTTTATLQSYIDAIQRKTDNITNNATDDAIASLTIEDDAIPAAKVQPSASRTFVSQSDAALISTNAANIATNSTAITEIAGVLKDSGTGGVGIFKGSAYTTTESHLLLDTASATLQVGENTAVEMSESSPGQIDLNVQTGPTGSEVSTTAATIAGSTTAGSSTITVNADADFQGSVSGISAADLDDVTSAGSGAIITSAERTKLSGIETGAEVNVVTTNLGSANQTLAGDRTITGGTNDLTIANPGVFKITNSSNAAAVTVTPGSPSTIDLAGTVSTIPTTYGQGGAIRFQEFPAFGTSAVVLRGPGSIAGDLVFVLPSADGTNGQILQTNGSGVLSFVDAPSGGGSNSYVLASSSTRVPTYYASRYYWGSTAYGWDTDTGYSYSSTINTSLLDDYAHLGIVAPTDISTLKLFATMRNDTSADGMEISVYKGSRPNGSSSSITLSSLITVTQSTVTQDRHYSMDGTKTTAGISAGDLIFVAFTRTAGTTGTKYLNVSYTLHAE